MDMLVHYSSESKAIVQCVETLHPGSGPSSKNLAGSTANILLQMIECYCDNANAGNIGALIIRIDLGGYLIL